MIDKFWDTMIFAPDRIDSKGVFHVRIGDYPAVLWTLEKKKGEGAGDFALNS